MLEDYKVQVEKRYGECCGFAWDGPIVPGNWFYGNNRMKILFLLKEAYGYKDDDKYEIMDCPEGFNYSRTNRIISKLAYVLKEISMSGINSEKGLIPNDTLYKMIDPLYDEMKVKSDDDLMMNYSNIAIVEIKKLSGEAKSDYSDIRKHSRENAEFLSDQIRFLKPNIIFCGGRVAWDSLTQDMSVFEKGAFSSNERGVFKINNIIVYNSYHPSYGGFNAYDFLFDVSKSML